MYKKKGRRTVPRVVVECAAKDCEQLVTRHASNVDALKTGRTFCSKECRDATGCKPRTGTDKQCVICGEWFYAKKSETTKKCCSVKCNNIAQTKPKVVRHCEYCDIKFSVKPSQAGDRSGRFCSKTCRDLSHVKRFAGFDYNGKPAIIDFFGYVRVWYPEHARQGQHGRVLYHRVVMEEHLGRPLETEEQVDHINRIKTDNRIENLQILNASDHSVKTNGDRIRDVQEAKDVMGELEEYRRRFGPLTANRL